MSDAWIGAVDRPLEPLWRGLLVYRGLTLVSAIAVALYRLGEYAHPVGVVVVLGAMTAWTAATAYLYLVEARAAGRGGGRPRGDGRRAGDHARCCRPPPRSPRTRR